MHGNTILNHKLDIYSCVISKIVMLKYESDIFIKAKQKKMIMNIDPK